MLYKCNFSIYVCSLDCEFLYMYHKMCIYVFVNYERRHNWCTIENMYKCMQHKDICASSS